MKFDNLIVPPETTILSAMNTININGKGIVYVCRGDGTLAGAVTDGNIRRYIISGGELTADIMKAANVTPRFLQLDSPEEPDAFMKANRITSVPIVDGEGKVRSISFLHASRVYKNDKLNVPVVIMAGGKGTRLLPYTQILPKPLIPVGEKTITEMIMERFEQFGCHAFRMIVNYKKNLIKAFFADSDTGHDISFTDETQFMGTGGGLGLLKGLYDSTFFMTNCDIILDDDYGDILRYHREHRNIITVVCAMKKVVIPYGTIEISDAGQALKLTEKPTFSFMTNTGFYVIEPAFLDCIPSDTRIDITDLIQLCIDRGENVGVYPVSENAWMDMGRLDELEKMRKRLE
ncbi:MAG: sugar phosphate nucleotidyltransferase [Oscillibacter sp.]|nr:sugar phosphate nucleotidyltransferase [Oscillibacter sp.]